MKKCATLYLILSLLLLPNVALGMESAVLSLNSVRGEVGSHVEIVVFLENPSGTAGGHVVLEYDPDIVTPVKSSSAALTSVTSGTMFFSNLDFTEESVKLVWAGLKGKEKSGAVATVTFLIVNEGETNIKIGDAALSDEDGRSISLQFSDGGIVSASGSVKSNKENGSTMTVVIVGLLSVLIAYILCRYHRNKRSMVKK